MILNLILALFFLGVYLNEDYFLLFFFSEINVIEVSFINLQKKNMKKEKRKRRLEQKLLNNQTYC